MPKDLLIVICSARINHAYVELLTAQLHGIEIEQDGPDDAADTLRLQMCWDRSDIQLGSAWRSQIDEAMRNFVRYLTANRFTMVSFKRLHDLSGYDETRLSALVDQHRDTFRHARLRPRGSTKLPRRPGLALQPGA